MTATSYYTDKAYTHQLAFLAVLLKIMRLVNQKGLALNATHQNFIDKKCHDLYIAYTIKQSIYSRAKFPEFNQLSLIEILHAENIDIILS